MYRLEKVYVIPVTLNRTISNGDFYVIVKELEDINNRINNIVNAIV